MNRASFTVAVWVLATLTINCGALTHHVDLNSPAPAAPYTNWLTAATNIQDAVDVADAGDTVLVTNGLYVTGGRAVYGLLTNRVVINKPITVQSMNGPGATTIQGYQVPGTTNGNAAVRCVYLTNGATLNGFTLTSGATRGSDGGVLERSGGGLWCESTNALITNCVISNNVARERGGGVYRGTLDSCLLIGNSLPSLLPVAGSRGGAACESILDHCVLLANSSDAGGGADSCTMLSSLIASNTASDGGGCYRGSMVNCVLTGNTASRGGGAYGGTFVNCTIASNTATTNGGGVYGGSGAWLYNSIIYYNSAPNGPNLNGAKADNSCTTPPIYEATDITNPPVFVDLAGGDLRVQSNSPCINAGYNGYVTSGTDLDGNARIVGGTVDMGAYEVQSPALLEYFEWLQSFGLSTQASDLFADHDGEGMNNWQEWRAGTVPTNAASALRMAGVTHGAVGLDVSWDSVADRSYQLERSEQLGATPAFQSIATNIPGAGGIQTYNDTAATNGGPYFYRVGVQ